MPLIKMFSKQSGSKKADLTNLDELQNSLFQLSHDLKNNLLAIHASVGNIEKSMTSLSDQTEINNIERIVTAIDKKINDSIVSLNMTTMFANPITNNIDQSINLSMLDCINQAIATYPFNSKRQSSLIALTNSAVDFSFHGSKHLIINIFYCIIKNALGFIDTTGKSGLLINLGKTNTNNFINFKFNNSLNENLIGTKPNLFSLGTPQDQASGFNFISDAMKHMQGKVTYKYDDNFLMLTLLFSSTEKDTFLE